MYQEMLKFAQTQASQMQSTGQITPNDTICVILSRTKKYYVGVNRLENQNGMMVNVHAEIDAVQKMQAGGEFAVEALLLVSAMTLQPMLPCGGCIGFIVGQSPENANCQVMLPDRAVPITQVGQPAQVNAPVYGQNPGAVSMYGNAAPYGQPGNVSMYGNANPYGQPGAVSMYGNANPYGQPGAVSMYGNANPYGQQPGAASMYSNASPYGQQPGAASMYSNASPYAGNPNYMSSMSLTRHKKATNDKLRGKVNTLANAGKDIDVDDEPENKLFSKLFKK